MTYQLVFQADGGSTSLATDDLEFTCATLGLAITGTETRTNLRPCLQGQPKIAGMIGPCYGGDNNGTPVIRYEDQATYTALSV
ncbi:hypothetical protein QCN27_20450 [Cereibacter sp. SYSU M97828]|nr:hypothetical protein [Cereibacter flavus]